MNLAGFGRCAVGAALGIWLFGVAEAHAALITLQSDSDARSAVFVSQTFKQSIFTGTAIPTDAFVQASLGAASSRTDFDFYEQSGQTILNFAMSHVRTGNIVGDYADSISRLSANTDGYLFTANQNTVYEATGFYDASHLNSIAAQRFTLLLARLTDLTTNTVLFSSQQLSNNTSDESFVLGGIGGDAGNSSNFLQGTLTGQLLAGHNYRFEYETRIANGFQVDGGGTAKGQVRLTIGEASPVPEPSSAILLLCGILGTGICHRRSRREASATHSAGHTLSGGSGSGMILDEDLCLK